MFDGEIREYAESMFMVGTKEIKTSKIKEARVGNKIVIILDRYYDNPSREPNEFILNVGDKYSITPKCIDPEIERVLVWDKEKVDKHIDEMVGLRDKEVKRMSEGYFKQKIRRVLLRMVS